jgi:hypothetical protein
MAMKWLLRIIGKGKKPTPIPPKPYVEPFNASLHLKDPRYYDPNELKHIDPEKPHWKDNKFESRERVPFFDVFGFNRDWSWSLYKLATLIFVGVGYHEVRLVMYGSIDDVSSKGSGGVSPTPDYARDDKATEEELRKAGFAFVGVKKLDHLGLVDLQHPQKKND